jgi:hypothetical protein
MNTNPKYRTPKRMWLAIALLMSLAGVAYAQKNVVQPGDPIIASSSNHPASEGVANAIDGTQAKYLNFDSKQAGGVLEKASGFVVTPSVGVTWVTGISMQSANDAPERDPKRITLEGSNDDTVTDFASGTWELIYKNDAIPAFAARYETQTLTFENFKPYKHYRWTVVGVQADTTCCMQIAEVQILGGTVPKNVAQPGDAIIASSSNHPASEGVANAIDGTQAKYLNFDSKQAGGVIEKPSGFVVTPSVGATVVQGISMQSANDAPERDPLKITLEGSNDETIADFSSGTWEVIYTNNAIPAFAARYQVQTFLFANVKPYKHYRWTVVGVQADTTCCMQIAEVQLLGSGAPKNVLQPGDPIIASSSNHPASEGVANAIDGTQAKYLNFDSKQAGGVIEKPSGFVVTPSVGATTIIGIFMQSANDAPERDPLKITVEGSNDDTVADFASGTWELVYRNDAVPAFATRYETQTFYFQNAKSYKHYRWTVVGVQADTTCCMQIAEVGLLAITSQTDCSKAMFLSQPVDTPVLSGSAATFFTDVNGPWPLQWYKNGVAIPGATQKSYTTEAVTAANETNVFTVEIVGCEISTPVKAMVFTPSSTKSVGIHFLGTGANGAPTAMLPDDIAGVQPQSYWNNATNAIGYTGDAATLPDVLLDSTGANSTITFEFTTSGTWGAGTGDGSATQRLLNGIAGANAVDDGDQTMIFHNVPAGSHAVLIYSVAPPLQVQTISYKIGTTTYYVRLMNSDEYKPAPGFYRGMSTDQSKPTLANFIRFDNVSPDANGDVVLTFNILVGSDQAAGVGGIQLVLNAPAVGAPPTVNVDPQPTVGPQDGAAVLTVQATGENLTYQWRKNGRALPNGGSVSGATTSTLVINPLTEADEAVYSVAVFSAAGSIVSKNATLYVSKYDIKDALAGYWKFDETTGKVAANAVSGGKPANLFEATTWVAGTAGNALAFDGASAYGMVDTYPKATRALSAAAWVKVDPAASSPITFVRNGEGSLRPPGDNNPVPSGQFELILDQDPNDFSYRLATMIQAGGAFPRVADTAKFPLGTWTHVAFTADGAQLRLYKNGQQVAMSEYLSTIKESTVPFLSIGVRQNTNDLGAGIVPVVDETPNYMVGQMDEVAVWNRALPGSEILKIYEAGKTGKALDTVVLEPPQPGAEIDIAREEAGVTITFTGVLQSADQVEGPYTAVAGATSPYTAPAGTGIKFYRAASQ